MNPGDYHFQKWEAEKKIASAPGEDLFDGNPGILDSVISTGPDGKRKTVLLSGPTGGGKTSLLNSLLGFSLFPEGCDQKTQVPTVVMRGGSFELKALGRIGEPLSKIPILKLNKSQVSAGIPAKAESILKRLWRKNEPIDAVKHRWETFWQPVREEAARDRCFCVKATVPAPWLPDSIRLVDLPGYAGWLKNENPALHKLHTTMMRKSAATIFVFKPDQLKRAHGLKYLGRQLKYDRRVSLLVNEMDGFDPYQAPDKENCDRLPPFESAWRGYGDHVWDLLNSECGWMPDNDQADLFFGASRLNREIDNKWHLTRIISEMRRLYQTVKMTFSAAGSNLRKKAA